MKHTDPTDPHAALGAQDAADIAQSLSPIEPESERAKQLKSRILRGLKATDHASEAAGSPPTGMKDLFTIACAQREWRAFIPGVDICVLHEDDAHRTALFRMNAGSVLPAHRHEMDEESMVLEGSATIGENLRVKAGDYQFAAAGSEHPLISSPSGCIVLVRGERRPRAQLNVGLLARLAGYFSQSIRK